MTARLLDGRAMSREIVDEATRQAADHVARGNGVPTLAIARVGDDPASMRYAAQVNRLFTGAGLECRINVLPGTADNAALEALLRSLSDDPAINGILLQLPLPPSFSQEMAVAAIDPRKDVDGVSPLNAGRLLLNQGWYLPPATPAGGVEILERAGIAVAGRRVVVVGRSAIVGRPLALLLLARDATVTLAHSRTVDLPRITREAEILAVAVGRPRLITADLVAPGATVLDFGINVVDGKVVGDVDFDHVVQTAGAITPVPGGTGPMTNAMLLRHTVRAAERQARTRSSGGAP